MNLATNVRTLRESKGWSQQRLAEEASVYAARPITQQYVANIESGKSLAPRQIDAIARALGTDARTLVYDTPEAGNTTRLPNDKGNVVVWDKPTDLPDDDNRVWIDKYDYHFSAGTGLLQWEVRENKALPFNLAFFQAKGVKPQNCKLLVARGDSMEPYLFNRDLFMIDETDVSIRDGEIYAVYFEDEPLVKQVFKQAGGGISLHSYNTRYPDKNVSTDQLQFIKVVGRVIYRSG